MEYSNKASMDVMEDDCRILDYTVEEIQDYINRVRALIKKGKYSIPLHDSRKKNKRFIERYNLSNKKRKKILSSLSIDDFCYGTRNRNEGYEDEILHVFSKEYEGTFPEGHKKIQIYIKMNLLEAGDKFVVAISFHQHTGSIKKILYKE